MDRRFILYAPVLFCATALLFIKSLVYARLFTVEAFGALNQAMLVASTFSNFGGIGLQLLAHKLLPRYYAVHDDGSTRDLLSSAVAVIGWSAVLAALVVAVAAIFGVIESPVVWYVTVLYAVAQYVFLLRLIDIKSKLRFIDHSLTSMLRACVLVIAGPVTAALTGDVAATLAIEALATFVLALPLLARVRGRLLVPSVAASSGEGAWLRANVGFALRLLWLNGVVTLLYSIDRWFGVAFLTDREYGIFAVGLLVILVFETLQTVVNVAAFPLMGRMVAHGEYRRAFRFASVATFIAVALMVVCYAPIVFLLDALIHAYLPLYVEATLVIKLALIVGAFRLADFFTSFTILCDEENFLTRAFAALLACVLIALLLIAWQTRLNPDRMMLITIGISLSAFLLTFSVAVRVRRRLSTEGPG